MDGLSFDEIAFILFRLGFYRDLLGMFPVLMVFLLEIYEHASRILRMGVHQNHGFQYYNGLILR